MYIPEELLQALKSGTMASMLGDGAGMTEVDLGMLDLPSGRLVAADPLGNDAVPFAQTVAPGRYLVILHVVRDAEGEEIVAFAEVRLNDAQPARYEMALTGEEDTSEPLEEDGFFGFEAEECVSILLESRVCLCRDPTCAGRWSAAVQRPASSVFPAAVSPALDDLAQSMKSNAGALENRFRKAEDRITEKNNRFFSEKGLTYSYSNYYFESQRTANELGKP